MAHTSEGLSAQFDATPQQLGVLYDDWSTGYDADMDAWGYEVPERLAALVPQSALDVVLDAGCGTGRSGVALRAAGAKSLTGLDYSAESLQLAAERTMEDQQVYDAVAQADLTKPLELETGSFSAVVSAGVFTYLPDVEAAVREFIRISRPGGFVVFSQRTDLWRSRECASVLAGVRSDVDSLEWSEPQPYLPGHPEYGDSIQVRYVSLVV